MNNETGYSPAVEVKYSFLKDKNGEWMEFLYSIVPTEAKKIEDQIRTVEHAEAELFGKFSIAPDSIAVKRIFSSDLITHRPHITEYKNRSDTDFIVYIRDPADYIFVKPLIDQYSQGLPAIYVKASVCRPGWLIEIEATAARVID